MGRRNTVRPTTGTPTRYGWTQDERWRSHRSDTQNHKTRHSANVAATHPERTPLVTRGRTPSGTRRWALRAASPARHPDAQGARVNDRRHAKTGCRVEPVVAAAVARDHDGAHIRAAVQLLCTSVHQRILFIKKDIHYPLYGLRSDLLTAASSQKKSHGYTWSTWSAVISLAPRAGS